MVALKRLLYKAMFPAKTALKEQAVIEEHNKEWKTQQWERLSQVLAHAYEHVPFYKEKFSQAGLTPTDIKTPEDLLKLPLTEKDELKEAFPDKILAKNLPASRGQLRSTSGSSGKPFSFYIDAKYKNEERKALFRLHNAIGLHFGDKIIRLRNSYLRGDGLRNTLQRHFGNTIHVTTQDMSLSKMPYYLAQIEKHKPKMIESFPQHILALARYMEEHHLHLPVENILIVGGKVFDDQKQLLEKVFQAKVFNEYGASEVMRVAYQCERRNAYHLDVGRYFIELIHKGKHAKEGELGEIVLTSLCNDYMPLIRYRIKDMAVAGGSCDCARTYPVVSEIKGRVMESIFLKNGRFLDQNLVRLEITGFSEKIDGFQTIYTKEHELQVHIIPKSTFSTQDEKTLIANLNKLLKGGCPIKIKRVDSIARYGAELKEMGTLTEVPPDLTEVQ